MHPPADTVNAFGLSRECTARPPSTPHSVKLVRVRRNNAVTARVCLEALDRGHIGPQPVLLVQKGLILRYIFPTGRFASTGHPYMRQRHVISMMLVNAASVIVRDSPYLQILITFQNQPRPASLESGSSHAVVQIVIIAIECRAATQSPYLCNPGAEGTPSADLHASRNMH